MATNIVNITRKEAIRVWNPNNSNNPPTASANPPIYAKKAGAIAKIPPKFATSFGNQNATSKSPKLASIGDLGIPNFADPKLKASKNPQTIRGIV